MVARTTIRNIFTVAVVLWAMRVWWLTWDYFVYRATYPRHLVESGAMVLVAAGLLLVVTRGGATTDDPLADASPDSRTGRQPWRLPSA